MYILFRNSCKRKFAVRPSRSFMVVSLTALLLGCAVGPDFKKPVTETDASFGSMPLPEQTDSADNPAGAAQKFALGEDIPAAWWQLFQSEPLDNLIRQALTKNPDLAAAQASLRIAQENTLADVGLLFPEVVGSFDTRRQKTAGASGGNKFSGSIYTLHNASVSVSYGLDIFGASRRNIEQSAAEEEFQRYQLEAAYLTLAGNIVTTAIQEASLREQLDVTQKIIEDQRRGLSLLQGQFEVGAVAKASVLEQQARLAQTQATVPGLEKQLAQTRHLLSILIGDLPSQDPKAIFTLDTLHLPEKLPVSLPSQLVDQRPDIKAAEANLHAASAAIGITIARRLPQIFLSADMGSVANNLGQLFTPGSGIWSLGVNLAETIFDGGRLRHQQHAAEANYELAAAQYRKTVLTSFQNVADTLHALQSDAANLKAQVEAERAAADSRRLAQEQFNAGAISALLLLQAQQTEQQAKLGLVQAKAQRFADTAALFQALGGGWWNRNFDIATPAKSETAAKNSKPKVLPAAFAPAPIVVPTTADVPAANEGEQQ